MSVQSVGAYRTGDRRPSNAIMQKIEDMGGPPIAWWDEPVTRETPRPVGAAEPPPETATPDDTANEAGRLLGHIRTLQAALADPEQTADMDLPQKIRAMDQLAGAIGKLGSVTGVKLTERAILASPLWQQLEERIMVALEPWPDALRAVAAALTPAVKDPKA